MASLSVQIGERHIGPISSERDPVFAQHALVHARHYAGEACTYGAMARLIGIWA